MPQPLDPAVEALMANAPQPRSPCLTLRCASPSERERFASATTSGVRPIKGVSVSRTPVRHP
jgi:hypothetical protein